MKKRITYALLLCFISAVATYAQTNTFPQTGNVGIGTLAPASNLQVIGASRLGSSSNYAQIDANGSLRFIGSSAYKVQNNKYVFQSLSNSGYGLFFNSTLTRYEFRDSNARPVFDVDMNLGNGTFFGGVKIGNSINNIAGNLRWTGKDFEGYNGSTWLSLTGGQSWSLTGNTGTSQSGNFIGTTDNNPIIFKVNSGAAGFVSPSNSNTAFGFEAQIDNGLDLATTAYGFRALTNNTGYFNTAIGLYALNSNTTGAQNTALGANALRDNISGVDNTALGHLVLTSNTTGSGNTGVGNGTLSQNTTGGSNTGIGETALQLNTTGDYNIAIGSSALSDNTTGNRNTATGGAALSANTTGEENTATGSFAMFISTTGINNVAVGSNALYNNTTGNANVGVGRFAGSTNKTGSNNTSIGNLAGPGKDTLSNTTAVGYLASTTASNQVRIGNSSVTSIGGYRAWTNLSDGRVKKNIKANVPGLVFINLLKPVTYNLDLDAADKIMAKTSAKDAQSKQTTQEEINARRIQEQIVCTGFIAQDVELSAKKIGYDFEGVDAPKNDRDLYGLRYSEFVVPLVKAVQELSKMNDDKDAVIKQQQQQLNDIMERLANLENQTTAIVSPNSDAILQNTLDFSLEQNTPNPSNGSTVIRYRIPANVQSASINVSDMSGHVLKTYSLTNKGVGSITLIVTQFAAGNYFYSLVLNGKKVATKQMSVLK